jgi:hypothetical protein
VKVLRYTSQKGSVAETDMFGRLFDNRWLEHDLDCELIAVESVAIDMLTGCTRL